MSKEFLTAVKYVQKLSQTPINDELSNLYKYYKQATEGNINISQPSILNIKARKKWLAWNSVKNTTKNVAEREYVILVNQLIQKYGIN
jgi:diazepam-binding inhibitor (GABA receptor modulating acyl-CoA-binding protein)